MGLIKVRLRRSKDQPTEPSQQPVVTEPIKRYRVQSMPVPPPTTQLQYSRSVRSHKDDFRLVTQTWKRQEPGPIQILEPSETSFRSAPSTYSGSTCESMVEVKTGPQQDVSVGSVSPTFSLCGSEMSSPSLSYTDSISSNSSGWSYKSEASVRRKKSYSTISAGIPPLLPAHRTFSGNPHYGSFCKPKRSSENLRGHHRTASDYIPVHVFTRQCSQLVPNVDPVKLSRRKLKAQEHRFSLDGYVGDLRVVNTTPPGSPPMPAYENSYENSYEHSYQHLYDQLPHEKAAAPERYRVPSKAALMDY